MSHTNAPAAWVGRLQLWLRDWGIRLGLLKTPPPSPPPGAPYPDYVPCPHCGEPEVEVWCYEKTVRCHNCGKTFEHAVPPDCLGGDQSSQK
ncbi:MAG TPA: hypothetical protein VI793_12790 [Anaerolineales bacterium]|nr:hypothetical protein [Anaerolineales bacterium]